MQIAVEKNAEGNIISVGMMAETTEDRLILLDLLPGMVFKVVTGHNHGESATLVHSADIQHKYTTGKTPAEEAEELRYENEVARLMLDV